MRKTFLLFFAALPAAAGAETLRLPVTADVGLCAHPNEIHLNTGGNTHIRIKGNEHYYLFDFDATPLRTRQITSASLHLKPAGGHLRRMAVCTVPAEWTEGTAVNKPQDGSTCFTHLKYPAAAWTDDGGTMLDATFNSPLMLWRAADVTKDKDGWLVVPVAPELVQAVAVGLSHGLVLADEKGQTRENHDVFTREQSNATPYLTVEGNPHHVAATLALQRAAPPAEPFPQGASFDSGAIRVDVDNPFPKAMVEPLGHRVLLLEFPLAPRRVAREMVTFRSRKVVFEGLVPGRQYAVACETFVGPQGHVSPPVEVQASPALPAPAAPRPAPAGKMSRVISAGGWRVEFLHVTAKGNPKAQPDGKSDTSMSAPFSPRNAWAGLQCVLAPPDGGARNVSLMLTPPAFRGPQAEAVPPLGPVRCYRIWSVQKDNRRHPEILVPLRDGQTFDIPWKADGEPGQTSQPIFLDIWVPRVAAVGPYEGTLKVRQDGQEVLAAPFGIEVTDATLPDEFVLAGDMNAYNSPAGAMGARESDPKAFLEMERKYYRLAHAHRMTLNVLPYSQSGSIDWRGAPRLAGRSGQIHVADWSEWDDRYGPLLSGAAFAKETGYVGPGEGVPIRHMYLPFHENWPCPLVEQFTPWPPPKDYQKMLAWTAGLPPIEKCLSADYQAAWPAVLKQFEEHLAACRWTRTRCQVYLNNKYYFREKGGRGISLWLLDEPMYADDFLALEHFGRLSWGSRVMDYAPPRFDYRVDLSRPGHERGWLQPYATLFVCPDQLYPQRRWFAQVAEVGGTVWNYRMPPSFGEDNIGWAVWPVQSYCWGATGTLPWQTIGSDGDLDKADETALMYPGRKFGLDEPIPSLRMKAWREGLQTAELLRLLRTRMNWNDAQLRAFVGQACGLDGWKAGNDPGEEAGIVTFRTFDADALDRLKRAAAEGPRE